MDRSVGSPRTGSVVEVREPGVSVFGSPLSERSEHIKVNRLTVSCFTRIV